MNPYLFVYGTLLRTAVGEPGDRERRRLQRVARFVGDATIPGRLYDLGRYPGLLLGGDAADIVYGEVVCLVRPTAALRWLDAYEGLAGQTPAAAEYARVETTVTLLPGHAVLAWVYVYQQERLSGRRLTEGRWRTRGGPAG